jgi:hypothetical protein
VVGEEVTASKITSDGNGAASKMRGVWSFEAVDGTVGVAGGRSTVQSECERRARGQQHRTDSDQAQDIARSTSNTRHTSLFG